MKSKILNIVPKIGVKSETFVMQRIYQNKKMGFDNLIFSDPVGNCDDMDFAKISESKGRYRNKIIGSYYKIKDIFFGNYHSFSEKKLLRVISDYKPDIIHCHFGYQAFSLLKTLDKIESQIQIIVSFHGSDILSFIDKNPSQISTLTKLYEKENIVFTFPTQFLLNEYLRIVRTSEERLHVIPNTFEPAFINENKLISIQPYDRLNIVNVSRLVNWKGHKYIIKGFAKFIGEYGKMATLKIIGDGPELNKLKELVDKLNINDSVDFLGAVEHTQVMSVMQSSNVFLHAAIIDPKTNQQESFGIALLEAISRKLFCITTDTGGLKDVIGCDDINKENMIVIGQQSSQEIYESLCYLYNEGGNINDKYVEDRVFTFSLDNVNNMWSKIFNNIKPYD